MHIERVVGLAGGGLSSVALCLSVASSRSRKQDSDDEGLDSDEGESGITIIRPLTEVSRIPDVSTGEINDGYP